MARCAMYIGSCSVLVPIGTVHFRHWIELNWIPYTCLQGIKFCGLWFWQESANVISTKIVGARYSREVSTMFWLCYLFSSIKLAIFGVCTYTDARSSPRRSYSAEYRAHIGRYAAKHGPTKALRHFTVPVSTAHPLKKQYLADLHDRHQNSVQIPQVNSTKACGHPHLLKSTLDWHLKLMDSQALAVTRPSKVVSVLCIQKTLYTTIEQTPWQSVCCCHNEDILHDLSSKLQTLNPQTLFSTTNCKI